LADGENAVWIHNVTVQDRGNYTCHIVYTYMGKQYNVSRTVNLEVKGECVGVILFSFWLCCKYLYAGISYLAYYFSTV